jgi:Ubiquitin family
VLPGADTCADEEHRFNMDSFDTVKFLKDKIQAKTRIPAVQMAVFFGRVELSDDRDTLEDCGLEDGSPVHVVPKLSPRTVGTRNRRGTNLLRHANG